MYRLFKESWSQGMKQMIANMTDAEYNEWYAVVKASSPVKLEAAAKGLDADQSMALNSAIDSKIESWAKTEGGIKK